MMDSKPDLLVSKMWIYIALCHNEPLTCYHVMTSLP